MTHYFENNIVEIKKEYTEILLDVLTPLIFEGLESIYSNAIRLDTKYKELEKDDPNRKSSGVLSIFQTFLKDIPNLNDNKIDTETGRIRDNSHCSECFDDLIRAVFKSNIILLTYNASGKTCKLVEERRYKEIGIPKFIHRCYIEIAKILYDRPELFLKTVETSKIKENQEKLFKIVKDGIISAVHGLLPMKDILDEYLSKDYIGGEVTKETKIDKMREREKFKGRPAQNGPRFQVQRPVEFQDRRGY